MKKYTILFLLFVGFSIGFCQVGINTSNPHQSAILDINSSDKGILIPKVSITSKNDIVTIPNPVKGLLIVCSADSGSGINKVFKDRFYVYSGVQWDELLEENKNKIDFLYPRLAAAGRKTTVTTCEGLNNKVFELDSATLKGLDGNIISTTGAITASRRGYYSWSIQLEQIMRKNVFSPYLSPGLISYEFRHGTVTTPTSQPLTFSGTVYLESGESSEPFHWFLGTESTDKCNELEKVGKQTVIWKFLGE